jgi:hypothetical protein
MKHKEFFFIKIGWKIYLIYKNNRNTILLLLWASCFETSETTNPFCFPNIHQLVFKLLEVTLVLVRKSLKFLLLGNQWTVFKLLSWWKLSLWWNFFDVISYWKITSLEWLLYFTIETYNYGLHAKLISIIIKFRKGYFPRGPRLNNYGY